MHNATSWGPKHQNTKICCGSFWIGFHPDWRHCSGSPGLQVTSTQLQAIPHWISTLQLCSLHKHSTTMPKVVYQMCATLRLSTPLTQACLCTLYVVSSPTRNRRLMIWHALVCVCVCEWEWVCVSVCMWVSVCVCVWVSVCMWASVSVWVRLCVCVHIMYWRWGKAPPILNLSTR